MDVKQFDGFVAWVDILGFKSIVGRKVKFAGNMGLLLRMLEDAVVYGQNIQEIASNGKPILVADPAHKKVRAHVMSDTFVFYTENNGHEDFVNLVTAVWRFMPNGYACISEDFALRGAITKGSIEVLCGSSSCIDSIILFQGDAVLKAVELESKVWGGMCIIDESLKSQCDELNRVAKSLDRDGNRLLPCYRGPLPMQNPQHRDQADLHEDLYSVNWPLSPVDIDSLTQKFQRMIKGANATGRTLAYAENTKRFYSNIRDNSKLPYVLTG